MNMGPVYTTLRPVGLCLLCGSASDGLNKCVTLVFHVTLLAAAAIPALALENPSSVPENLTVAGGVLYFSADDGVHGREPCYINGDSSPRLLDALPGAAGSRPERFLWFESSVYFVGLGKNGFQQLYRHSPETDQVIEIQIPDGEPSDPGVLPLGGLNGRFIFFATNSKERHYFSVEPGADAAARLFRLRDVDMSSAAYIIGDRVIFGCAASIYTTDGTVGPPALIADHISQSYFLNAVRFGDSVYCSFASPEYGEELLRTDGSADGTFMVQDICEGPGDSSPANFAVLDTLLLFSANDGKHGSELWCTRGGTNDAIMLKDIYPGSSSGAPHYLCVLGSQVFFVGDDGAHGQEIWLTDGTPEGTRMVCDLNPGVQGSGPWSLAAFKNALFFCAGTQEYGEEVYYTDGTNEGTAILKDLVPGPGWSGPDNLTEYNGFLYFTCNDGSHGEELWRTDGTTAGTQLVADIAIPRLNPSSSPRFLTALGDIVLFVADNGETGLELWRSDGSDAGTVPVLDIAPGRNDSAPDSVCEIGDAVCFAATNAEFGREIWISNGTATGTAILRDIWPGERSSNPGQLTRIGPDIYFTAADRDHGRELWCTGGTPESTELVCDTIPGPKDGAIGPIFEFFGKTYFYARQESGTIMLWQANGTDRGARPLASVPDDIPAWKNGYMPPFVFPVQPIDARVDLELLTLTSAVHPPGQPEQKMQAAVLGAWTFFVACDPCSGAELWRTDGTAAGTQMVADLFPGKAGSCPDMFQVYDGVLYFVAEHIRDGRVLWRTDGTANGTAIVTPGGPGYQYPSPTPRAISACRRGLVLFAPTAYQETIDDCGVALLSYRRPGFVFSPLKTIRRGSEGWPRQLTVAGDQVFFTVDDGVHGEELWRIILETRDAGMVKDLLVPGDLTPKRP